jgi:hypothetical protein
MTNGPRIAITLVSMMTASPLYAANLAPIHAFQAAPSMIVLSASDKDEKEAEKAAKDAEKAAEEAQKEAEKAAKEAEKAAEKAAKEAEKAAEEAAQAAEDISEVDRDNNEEVVDVIGEDTDTIKPYDPSDAVEAPNDLVQPELPPVQVPPVVTPTVPEAVTDQMREVLAKLTGMRSEINELRDAETILKIQRQRGQITQDAYKSQIRDLRSQEAISVLKLKRLKKKIN